MANLRADLLNEFRNQKYYAEMELVRLAQDPNMNYRIKIDRISELLGRISIINQKLGLADAYFAAPEPVAPVQEGVPAPQGEPAAQAPVPAPVIEQPVEEAAPAAPKPLVHQGQSHGE